MRRRGVPTGTARRSRLVVALVLLAVVGGLLALPTSPASRVATPSPSVLASASHVPSATAVPPSPPAGAPSTGSGSAPGVVRSTGPATPPPPPMTLGWHDSNFFQDVQVNFFGSGLPLGLQEVPYVNTIPTGVNGFWVNITASAPILFANLTIWGNLWPGANTSSPINGFSPTSPAVRPMVVSSTDRAQASYYLDNYRFFWPGSTVSFNLTVVGVNSTPSQVKSASNVSVTENYPGGFQDAATWVFTVASPWASPVFSNDIEILTSPNVLGPTVFAPNPVQTLQVTIESIPIAGVTGPIPAAALNLQVTLNGTLSTSTILFGPVDHPVMTLTQPVGPYGGAHVEFYVTAWLPFQGGKVDLITSNVVNFTWSPNGGWWHPLAGLTSNLELTTQPTLTASGTGLPGSALTLPTDQPVTVTVHEPIENVTIASAEVVFTFSDGGGSHSGSIPMTALSANTSRASLPGLPPGGALTLYLVAKDIYGNPVSSGNYSYSEAGPTNPSLPAGEGLLFLEVLDLSTDGLVPGFGYSVGNATWSESGTGTTFGFVTPLLPASSVPIRLDFGTYQLSIGAFGVVETAVVTLSPASPTPTVVFYGESNPLPLASTQTLSAQSIGAVAGLVAAAVITLPLVLWFEERRAKAEEEQRRITL